MKIKDKHTRDEIKQVLEGAKKCKNSIFKPERPKHKGRPHDFLDTRSLEHEIHELLDISVGVEVNQANERKFTYRLNISTIGIPIFNYDSCGATHINLDNSPLGRDETQVPCPHFNYFDSETGERRAYHIKEMYTERTTFFDCNAALSYFFKEAKITPIGPYPMVKTKPKLPGLEPKNYNPMEGINF